MIISVEKENATVHIQLYLCPPRLWSLWKRWQAKSMWDSAMPRECFCKINEVFHVNIFSFSIPKLKTLLLYANWLSTALWHYWCFYLSVSDSSQKKKQATEILPLDTTWKRKRSVKECWNMWNYTSMYIVFHYILFSLVFVCLKRFCQPSISTIKCFLKCFFFFKSSLHTFLHRHQFVRHTIFEANWDSFSVAPPVTTLSC